MCNVKATPDESRKGDIIIYEGKKRKNKERKKYEHTLEKKYHSHVNVKSVQERSVSIASRDNI